MHVLGFALVLVPLLAAEEPEWWLQAEELAKSGRVDRAIVHVEAHLDSAPGDVQAWRWLARTLEQTVATEGRSGMLLSEAAAAWDEVCRLDPEDVDARRRAARNRLGAGEFEAAIERSTRVLELERARAGGVRGESVGVWLAGQVGAFTAGFHRDRESFVAAVVDLRARVSEAREWAPAAAEVEVVVADWLASLELGDEAFEVLRRALEFDPDTVEVHRALIELALALEVEQRLPRMYDEWVRRWRGRAVVHWYAGYAYRLAGDLASRERRNEAAIASYTRAAAELQRASELDAEFAQSALWVEMQARTASGWAALDAGDEQSAEASWLAVLAEWPEFAEREDGLGRTPSQGLGRLGGRYHVREELVAAERVSRRLAEVTQDAWSWNNVAYLNRELASDAERFGGAESFDTARSLFRESWKAYRTAAKLAPHEPRIVNDTALVQVYHLHEDLDGAERMLKDAIATGRAQIEAMGPHPDEDERFPVAQAIGDAYQNLGHLYLNLRGEPARAREFFQLSMDTDSGVRRDVAAILRGIDAGANRGGATLLQPRGAPAPESPEERPQRGEREEPDDPEDPESVASSGNTTTATPDAGGSAAQDAERAAQAINWERSIEGALVRGAREGVPVLVYHRPGRGLGPSVEYVQRHLHSRHFARSVAGAIAVVADRLRHTFSDRARDGRLVPCPRVPGLTCREHMAPAIEFEPLWFEHGERVLNRASAGLFRVGEGELTRVDRAEDTFERFRPGEDFPRAEGEAALVFTQPEDPDSDEALVRSRLFAHRRRIESRLFSRGEDAGRRSLVAALAAHPSADNDELLRALALQQEDGELSRMALEAWPERLEAAVPVQVLQTARESSTRTAAAATAARLGGAAVDRVLTARALISAGAEPGAVLPLDLESLAAGVR